MRDRSHKKIKTESLTTNCQSPQHQSSNDNNRHKLPKKQNKKQKSMGNKTFCGNHNYAFEFNGLCN